MSQPRQKRGGGRRTPRVELPDDDSPADIDASGLERRETWRSIVFMTSTDVFKIKKAVRLDALDYTTIDARRRACEVEFELNASLAPDVYLGVVPVTREEGGGRVIGGTGETVDWALHMLRLADEDRADERLRRDALGDDDVRAIALRVAAFHEIAPRAQDKSRATLRHIVDLDLAQTTSAAHVAPDPELAIEAARWQRAFMAEHAALFERRASLGFVRDGHGDLGLEHVFVDEAEDVRIINRLEFDSRLRALDIAADIASLSTDFAALGRADLAERFLADYAAEANDFDLYPLIDFYASLRASLRGKIEWFYAEHFANDPLGAEARRARAERCFKLAASATWRPMLPPVVIAVGGLVASGKSTVSRHIGRIVGAPVVGSDRTRDFLLGARLNEELHEVRWERAYEPGFAEEIYAEVMRRASAVLRSGRPVVIDGCLRTAAQRGLARELAKRFGHPFLFVEARVSDEVCRQRLHDRSIRDGEPDSTWLDIAKDLRAQWEEANELASEERITLDTALPLDENAERLRERLPTWPSGLRS